MRLKLNERRARARQSWAVKEGIELALGGSVPADYAEAVADSPEEAALNDYRQQAARAKAAAMAGLGFD